MARTNRNQPTDPPAIVDRAEPPPIGEFESPPPSVLEETGGLPIAAPGDKPALSPVCEPRPSLALDVPIFRGVIDGYCSDHVDMHLAPDQAKLLRRISIALDQHGATHPTGGRRVNVSSPADAIRWMLGQLTEQLAAAGAQ